TKQYDKLNRLLNIYSLPSASGASSFGSTYLHNDANQRIRNDKADGSAWSYEYDPLGQVTQAKRHWSDGALVAGNSSSPPTTISATARPRRKEPTKAAKASGPRRTV